MRKILTAISIFIFMNLNSQTKRELFNAGIKIRTVELIHKKFEGDISKAINKWADSGNGKLSQEFVEAAANLLTNSAVDPFGKIPEFKFSAVKVEKVANQLAAE